MKTFETMADLAQHFMHKTAGELTVVRAGLSHGLPAAADLLYNEARSEFGTYQKGEGPFQDWPELADATKEDRLRRGFTENDPLLRSGHLRDGLIKEVDDFEATIGSEDPVMLYQELGTKRIPPRPVLGIALQRCWPAIQQMIGNAVASGFIGNKSIAPGNGYDLS